MILRLPARQIQLVIGQSALHLDEGQSIKRETCLFYELSRNKRACYVFLGTVYGSTELRLVRFEVPSSFFFQRNSFILVVQWKP